LRNRAPVDFRISRDAAQAHEELLEAIVKKQYEKARKLMGKHIAAVKKSYSAEQTNSKTQLEIHQ
jgi:DNA-binding GntR family transcriptional regulator